MSKGKEFPPRLVVPRDEVNAEGGFGTYFAVWTPADPFVVHPTEDIEYLSSSEHSHLLAEARREAEYQTILRILNAAEQLSDTHTVEAAMSSALVEVMGPIVSEKEARHNLAKAAEGAIDG